MDRRDQIIKNVSNFLGEDITDQFDRQEVYSIMEGKTYFYVGNKAGDKVKIENIYSEYIDILDYAIVGYEIIIRGQLSPPTK